MGMKKAGEHVRVNFGQSPFVFDIDGMMSASNHFSYLPSSLGSPSSDSLLVTLNLPGFSRPFEGFGTQAAVTDSLLHVDDPDDSDDEPPPLVTPPLRRYASSDLRAAVRGEVEDDSSEETSPRAPPGTDLRFAVRGGYTGAPWITSPSRRASTDLRTAASVERISTTARDLISSLSEPVIPDHTRSARTTALLDILHQQSREGILNNTGRHIIRIASGIDEHRTSLLSSGSTTRELSRIAASERALDDLGDRVIREHFPTSAALASDMSSQQLLNLIAQVAELDRARDAILGASTAEEREAAVSRARTLPNDQRELSNNLRLAQRVAPLRAGPLYSGSLRRPPRNVSPPLLFDRADLLQRPTGNMSPPPLPHRPSLDRKLKDVNTMTDFEKQQERRQIRQQIEMTSTVNLAPPLSETELIQSLVCYYPPKSSTISLTGFHRSCNSSVMMDTSRLLELSRKKYTRRSRH